jgi:hypothetical protein
MNIFRIFTDFAATAEAVELLQAGTAEHELVFSKTPVSSVLVTAGREPQFATVDVAFGQPDPSKGQRSKGQRGQTIALPICELANATGSE